MTFWVAGAAVASAAIGAYSSNKAAKSAEKGAERASDQIAASADLARQDVNAQFPSAQQDLMAGAGGAFDIFNQGMSGQNRLFNQGNVNAQNTTARGFSNVQNALLGGPIDPSAFAAKQAGTAANIANPFVSKFSGGFTDLQANRDAEIAKAAADAKAAQLAAASAQPIAKKTGAMDKLLAGAIPSKGQILTGNPLGGRMISDTKKVFKKLKNIF